MKRRGRKRKGEMLLLNYNLKKICWEHTLPIIKPGLMEFWRKKTRKQFRAGHITLLVKPGPA